MAASPTHKPPRRQFGYSKSFDLERDRRISSSFSPSFLDKTSVQQNNCASRQFSTNSTTSPISYGQPLPHIHPTIPFYIGRVSDSSTRVGSEQTTPRHFSLIHASPVDQVTWWRSIERRAGACGKLLEGYSDACKFLQSPEDTALVLSEAIRNNDRGRAIWCEVMEVLGPFNKYCEGQKGQAPSPQGAYRMAAESLRSLEISDIYFKQQLENCKDLIQLQQKIKAAGPPAQYARFLSLKRHQTTTSPVEELTKSVASSTKSLPVTSPDRLFHYWSSPERRPLRADSTKEHDQKRARYITEFTQRASTPSQKGYTKTSPSKEKLLKKVKNDSYKKSPRKYSDRGSRHGAQHVTNPDERGSASGRNDTTVINEQSDHKTRRPIQPSDIHNLFQLSKRDEVTRNRPKENDRTGTPDPPISYAGVAKEGARKSDVDRMTKNRQRAPVVKAKQDTIEDIIVKSLGPKQMTSVVQDHAVQEVSDCLPHWPSISSSYCTDSDKAGAQTAVSIVVRALIADKQGDEGIKHNNKRMPPKQRGTIPERIAPADIPPYIQQASKTAAELAGCGGPICRESEAEVHMKQSALEQPTINEYTVSSVLQKDDVPIVTLETRSNQARPCLKRGTLSIPSGVELGLVSRKRNPDFQASKCQTQETHMDSVDSSGSSVDCPVSTLKQSSMKLENMPYNNYQKAAHSCQAELIESESSTTLGQDVERTMVKHEAIAPAKIWPHEDPARKVRENSSRQDGNRCDTSNTYAYKSVEKYAPTKSIISSDADIAYDVDPSRLYLPEKESDNLEPLQHKPLNSWSRRMESGSKSPNIAPIKVASPKSNLLSVSIPVDTAGDQAQNKRDDSLLGGHRHIPDPKPRANIPPRPKPGGRRGHTHIDLERAGYPFKSPASTAADVQGHGKGAQPQSKVCALKATNAEAKSGRSQNRFNDLASPSSSSASISTSSVSSNSAGREEKRTAGGKSLVKSIPTGACKKGNKPKSVLPSASLTVSKLIKAPVSKSKKKKNSQFVESGRRETDAAVSTALLVDAVHETQRSQQVQDGEDHNLKNQGTQIQECEQDDEQSDDPTKWISLTSNTDSHDNISSNAKEERVRKLIGYFKTCAENKGSKDDEATSSASSETSRLPPKPIRRIKSKGAKAHKLRQGRQGVGNLTQRPPAILATNHAVVSASEAGTVKTAAAIGSPSSTACNTDSSEIDQPPASSYQAEHDPSSDFTKIRRLSVRSQQFQVVCAASERMQTIADGIKEEEYKSSASILNDNGRPACEAVTGLGLPRMDLLEKRLTSAKEPPSENVPHSECTDQRKLDLAENELDPGRALKSSIEGSVHTNKAAPRRRICPILVPKEEKVIDSDRLIDVMVPAATETINTVSGIVPPPTPKLPTTPIFTIHPSLDKQSSPSLRTPAPVPSKSKKKKKSRQMKNNKLRKTVQAEGNEQEAPQNNPPLISDPHSSVRVTNSSTTALSGPSVATSASENNQNPPSSACSEILSFLNITSSSGPVRFTIVP